jgi:hypothetical protein
MGFPRAEVLFRGIGGLDADFSLLVVANTEKVARPDPSERHAG